MAGNSSEGLGDDFFEQILAVPSSYSNSEVTGYGRAGAADVGAIPMVLQLGSSIHTDDGSGSSGSGLRGVGSIGMGMPLGLNLKQGFLRHDQDGGRSFKFNDGVAEGNNSSHHENHNHRHHMIMNHNNSPTNSSPSNSAMTGIRERDHMASFFPAFGQLQGQSVRPAVLPPTPQAQPQQSFQHQPLTHGSAAAAPAPVPPAVRPRVRARRGQATDPHSIAERLRRERIAERMKALQELVPSANKTDRAAMLDDIVDYVKFLRLQVKVLSMSRLGGAGAVAQLVADVPLSSEDDGADSGTNPQAWGNWSNDETEQQVAKLMEEDVGAAMQLLQSKSLCIMPISLASAIFHTSQSGAPALVKSESSNFP